MTEAVSVLTAIKKTLTINIVGLPAFLAGHRFF